MRKSQQDKTEREKGKSKYFQLLPFIFSIFPATATAQIVPDSTLTNNSVVPANCTECTITGGTTVEQNLFHSFREFAVPTGGTAIFQNAPNIENIFTRVTGNSISNIDGLIQTQGLANLFLINPNGILFGPNAQLNIGGSFFAATANSFKFSDGSEFSSTNPQAAPILKVNVPIGLQYGSNPGSITVQGNGNNLGLDPFNFSLSRANRPAGLQVSNGQTLALLGGQVVLQGGNLTADSGRIEVWSVNNGQLSVFNNDGQLEIDPGQNPLDYGDIALSQAASIDASGNSGGDIEVVGNQIGLTDGSVILSNTLGDGIGGNLTVKGSESVAVTGFALNENIQVFSGLLTDVGLAASGSGGNLAIETENLLIADGGQVSSGTFGSGNSGTVTVTAKAVELSGGSVFGGSGLFSPVAPGATGNGGILTIDTESLKISNGAVAFVSIFGDGDAGLLNVKAKNIELSGSLGGLFAEIFFGATGKGGQIQVETDRLLVTEGAQISANSFGTNDAGSISIKAQDIEISGVESFSNSGVFANISPVATGNGGTITIDTNNLLIKDGGNISAKTSSNSSGGSIAITAKNIEMFGIPSFGRNGVFAEVDAEAQGKGGQINIVTDRLSLADGSQISTETLGIGDAGNLGIDATEVEIVGTSSAVPTGLFTSTRSSGNGGNLNITADSVRVADGAQIAVSTNGSGNAGNLLVQSNNLEISGRSEELNATSGLFASTIEGTGNGGDLTVTGEQLTVKDGATISVSNFSSLNSSIEPGQGAPGNITLAVNSISLDNQGSLTAVTVAGDKGNINIQSQQLQLNVNSVINTNAQGEGSGGSIEINTDTLSANNSQITANASGAGSAGNISVEANAINLEQSNFSATGDRGNINLNSGELNLTQNSTIATNAEGESSGGNITLQAQNLALTDNSSIATNASGEGSGGSIEINTDNLSANNSQITANASGAGSAGNISVQANAINLEQSNFSATGDRGNINLNSGELNLTQNSTIATNAEGESSGGNITLQAQNLALADNSSIATNAEGEGSGGSIEINTDTLSSNNSQITANASGAGSAGNISVEANAINLEQSNFSATGDRGNINLNSGELNLTQNSTIATNAEGESSGGNITLQAQNLALADNSSIATNAQGEGSGGSIDINTDTFSANNSQITANASGVGSAGNINVEANAVNLAESTVSASGDRGNINLNSGELNLTQNSTIATNAEGESSGGNITLQAQNLALADNSSIATNAQGEGSGGSIDINTDTFSANNSQITANASGAGSAGNISVEANAINLEQSSLSATGDLGNINLKTNNSLILSQGSTIATNGTGTGSGGNINIETNNVIASGNSDITANAVASFGGRVIISAKAIFGTQFREQLTPDSDITATSELGPQFNGVVEIRSPDIDPSAGLIKLSSNVIDPNAQVVKGCTKDVGNVFVISGRGGLPEAPNQMTIRGRSVWKDLRDLAAVEPNSNLSLHSRSSKPEITDNKKIIEAQGWQISADGKVNLVADTPKVSPTNSWHQQLQCQNPSNN